MDDATSVLKAMNFNFSPAAIISGLIFSTVGFFVFMHGKKNKKTRPFAIGIALMVYPYFISNAWLMTGIGLALSATLYFWRE